MSSGIELKIVTRNAILNSFQWLTLKFIYLFIYWNIIKLCKLRTLDFFRKLSNLLLGVVKKLCKLNIFDFVRKKYKLGMLDFWWKTANFVNGNFYFDFSLQVCVPQSLRE